MAASWSDSGFLAGDPAFQNRVKESMVAAAVSISNEGWAVAFHKQRLRQCVIILNDPEVQKIRYAIAVATDTNVRSDATVAGTVVLTGTNVAAQGALVTDAHIDTAIAGQFNSFFDPTA